MGSDISKEISDILGSPKCIPIDLFRIEEKHKINYQNDLIQGMKNLKGFAKFQKNIAKLVLCFDNNGQLLNQVLFSFFWAMPIVGNIVSIGTIVMIFLLKLFSTEVKMSTEDICKKEIASELSNYLLLDISSYMESAAEYINCKNYKNAELQVNSCYYKLRTFFQSNKIMQWARALGNREGLKVLWYFYKISLMVGNIYTNLDFSPHKEEHKKEVDSLISSFRKQILDFRAELIVFDSVSEKIEQSQGHLIQSTIDEYTFSKINFEDKLYPEKKYSHSFSLSHDQFSIVCNKIFDYRNATIKLWDQQLDNY